MTTPKPRRLRLVAGLMTLLLGFSLAACSDPEPEPIPGGDDTATSTSDPTTSPTPDEPAWEDDYTDEQLTRYEQALERWTEYETKSEPIYAAGKATPEAEALFKAYYPSPIWQGKFQVLQGYEQGKVRIEGLPTVHWSEATSITKSSATIRQCVDYSTVELTQNGERPNTIPDPEDAKPQVRDIHLSKPEGYNWLIYQETSRFKGEIKRCNP